MFIPVKDYLKRITFALEHVAAPQIESDFARGQVLAAVFLLDNLSTRIDYKPEIITKEIEKACGIIREVAEAAGRKAGDIPEELESFLRELDKQGPRPDIQYRDLCNKTLRLAIDYFFANRESLAADEAHELEGKIIRHITDINMRDLGMFQISCSAKLIQSREKT